MAGFPASLDPSLEVATSCSLVDYKAEKQKPNAADWVSIGQLSRPLIFCAEQAGSMFEAGMASEVATHTVVGHLLAVVALVNTEGQLSEPEVLENIVGKETPGCRSASLVEPVNILKAVRLGLVLAEPVLIELAVLAHSDMDSASEAAAIGNAHMDPVVVVALVAGFVAD